ncbi:hypothetical protein G6F57_017747 [Rhizopus arrhizus]|nr:hypothetical protein G6F22_019559 [Rhizopus arrhizus]KAG1444703.1 hypothetical protein G6F57_017747 [Rhizopus arrhizus]
MATSSTQAVPDTRDIPEHVAIIMDGNGRWATRRLLPRTAGHAKGVQAVRRFRELAPARRRSVAADAPVRAGAGAGDRQARRAGRAPACDRRPERVRASLAGAHRRGPGPHGSQ